MEAQILSYLKTGNSSVALRLMEYTIVNGVVMPAVGRIKFTSIYELTEVRLECIWWLNVSLYYLSVCGAGVTINEWYMHESECTVNGSVDL